MMVYKEFMKFIEEREKELLHMDIKDSYKAHHKYGLEDTLDIEVPKPDRYIFEFTPKAVSSSRFTHTLR